jgi:hypothetical protein
MATTTNYSWSTPDDTALVKDGAAAIRTLGSSADTTVKALNPGTTAGDLDYYTTSTAKARLAIGTANQQLRVNSGATAPEWFTPGSAGGMTLISTTTLSSTSVLLSSIPQTYKHLQIIVRNYLPSQDGYSLYFRMNDDSTASRHRASYSAFASNQTFNEAGWTTQGVDKDTSQGIMALTIYDYTNTTTWKMGTNAILANHETTSSNVNLGWIVCAYNQTSAISSIRILTDATSFTGEALLYGVS